MKKFTLILIVFNFINFCLFAQTASKEIDVKIGSAVKIEDANQEIFVVSSITKYKGKVIIKIYSKADISDSSIVLNLSMPVVNGYDYNFSDSELKDKLKQSNGKSVIHFSDIRRSEGTYVFTVPLVQTLSRFIERKKIYVTSK
ncbi:MAG TPA: hypothetical protein VGN64_07130 [Dyadobacter sp.]|jgi:hypothetical protein|nr:hypothetical protein [Dyadobacter sp.]